MPLARCSSPSYTPKAVFCPAVFPQALMSLSWLPLLLATGLEKIVKSQGCAQKREAGPKATETRKRRHRRPTRGPEQGRSSCVEEKMLSSPSVAGRPARPSLRVWGSVDGPSCRAEPRGRGAFNMGLGELKDQGPRASVRQSIHSNGHGCDQTQGGVLSLFGERGNPRFRPEHPGPRKPELQPHRPSQIEPSARRRHPRFCRLSEFIGWSGKGMVHQASLDMNEMIEHLSSMLLLR